MKFQWGLALGGAVCAWMATTGLNQSKVVRIPNIHGETIEGKKTQLLDGKSKFTVVLYTSTSCPLSQKYGPTHSRIESHFRGKDVRFIFINPYAIESRNEIDEQIKRLKLKGDYIHDGDQRWTEVIGARTTTESFVLDQSGTVLYRGAVDDQYVIGASKASPQKNYLLDALTAVLAGKTPKVAKTEAPGCVLAELQASVPASPTYHGDIQHWVQQKCLPCHRDGGVAPFSLESYEAVKNRAPMLRYVVDKGIMPPWFAAKGTGPWKNDSSLNETQKKELTEWIEAGMPRGEAKDAPKPVQFESGWTIGKPDVVLQLPNPIKIKESGIMNYRNIEVPTGFTEDKWVQKIEIVPGDRRAVHHVLVFVIPPDGNGAIRAGRAIQGIEELSGFFGAYVPGNSALVYPDGLAKFVPKGSSLRFQLHYTPYGKVSEDQTKIGLTFHRGLPKNEVHTASLANLLFSIPPGADNHPVEARLRVPTDVRVLSFLPHMHVRGKAARYELESEGQRRMLLDVPRYDFNWQLNYILENPLDLKKGDQLRFTAWYDNSEKNAANPDPKQTVRWGDQTFDEMHLGYLEYIVPGEKLGEGGGVLRRGRGAASATIEETFKRLDRNGDGFVEKSEARLAWNQIKAADANGDGKISLAEAIEHFGQ